MDQTIFTAFAYVIDGVIAVDKKGRVVFINSAAETITGWKNGEAVGMELHEIFRLVRAGTRTPVLNFLQNALRGGGIGIYDMDTLLVLKSGHEIYVNYSVSPLLDLAGYAGGAVILFRDITVQRKGSGRDDRHEKLETVGELASGVIHDFNNMLTVILCFSDLLLDSMKRDDERLSDVLEIQNAAKRASHTARQISAFSRHRVAEFRVIDPNCLLIDMNKMLCRVIGKSVEVVMLLEDDLGLVRVDSGQLEQVLVNLTLNSRDAMPSGGKLVFQTRNVDGSLEGGILEGECVELSVTDSGEGIDPSIRERVFDPFFTTKERGTGLGLPMCRRIVGHCGGTMTLTSELGRGTKIALHFPRIQGQVESRSDDKNTQGIPGSQNETILLVEDEVNIHQVAARILKKQGYQVLEAMDGEEALRILSECREGSVQLLITDIFMPKMGGIDLIRRVSIQYPEIKLICMSGYVENEVTALINNTKKVYFLGKPFMSAALVQKAHEVLNTAGC